MSSSEKKFSPDARAGARDVGPTTDSIHITSSPELEAVITKLATEPGYVLPVTERFTTTAATTGETGSPEVCWRSETMRIVRSESWIQIEALDRDAMGVHYWRCVSHLRKGAVRSTVDEALLNVCLSLTACPT